MISGIGEVLFALLISGMIGAVVGWSIVLLMTYWR